MADTWVSTREALTEMIAGCGLSWDKLSEETGVGKPSLYGFYHYAHGLSTPNTDRLLRYFGLRIIAPNKRKAR